MSDRAVHADLEPDEPEERLAQSQRLADQLLDLLHPADAEEAALMARGAAGAVAVGAVGVILLEHQVAGPLGTGHGGARCGRVPSQTSAAAEGIPERFVLKALRPLVHAGILRSLKGRQGGDSLRRPPEEIPLLEAVEAAHGPVRGDAPGVLKDHDDEGRKLQQRLQAVCDDAHEA